MIGNIDLFGNEMLENPIRVNIYADEAMDRKCPYTNNNWHYMCLIVERLDNPLLDDLINERFMNNFDKTSPFYEKNNLILHWTDMHSADAKNICKRWFKYITNPGKSGEKFYCYILGLNESLLNDDEFDPENKFNSIYNRFFRTAVEYALKCFFGDKKIIIIKNIYHEQGQQQHHAYFNWHPIEILERKNPEQFVFKNKEIIFLEKDHNKDNKANILQLCDCFLGACVNLLHGFENLKSNRSILKSELLNIISELFNRMINKPDNINSSYQHANRIMIRFFPKERTSKDDLKRYTNQFYTKRAIKFIEDNSGQLSLF